MRQSRPARYTHPVIAAVIILSLLLAAAVILSIVLLRERAALLAARNDRDRLAQERIPLENSLSERTNSITTLETRLSEAREHLARAEERLSAATQREIDEKQRIEALREQFRDTFSTLAAGALDANTKRFLDLARETFGADQHKRQAALDAIVKPVAETLKKTDEKLAEIEKSRAAAYAGLSEQIRHAADSSAALRTETARLAQALRKPQVRGRYGEIQLQRVVELAGMREWCDFSQQTGMLASDGARLRPDMVVRLPNERVIVIDAKTNIEAYLDAIEAESTDQAEAHLDRFAALVEKQAEALAKKEYWESLPDSPEFVVMFIPGDQFIDAALQRRPALLDLAATKRVIIASPSTLIGLLRAVYIGWREKSITDSAEELFRLGRELHERAVVALQHAAQVGQAIETARDRYNKFVGSVDQRLMPTIRKFEETGARSARERRDPAPVEGGVRQIDALADSAALPPTAPGNAAESEPRPDTNPPVVHLFDADRVSAARD